MNIFEFKSYKVLIKERIAELKQLNPKYTFDALSIAMDVHKPYLSKVLNKKGNLNSDQLYKCSKYLKFTELEKNYFALLFEENISTLEERKVQLQKDLDRLRKKALKSDSLYPAEERANEIMKVDTYFLDPYFALIHMFLLIEKYRKDIDSIAKILNLAKERVHEYIESLHNMKIIEKKETNIKILKEFIHLPENSNLITAFRNLSKAKSLEKIAQLNRDDYLSLHIFFTADETARNKIQKLFLEFLNEAKKIADKSKSEEVFQLNFDLLKWN